MKKITLYIGLTSELSTHAHLDVPAMADRMLTVLKCYYPGLTVLYGDGHWENTSKHVAVVTIFAGDDANLSNLVQSLTSQLGQICIGVEVSDTNFELRYWKQSK